jgi:hypothetical protein
MVGYKRISDTHWKPQVEQGGGGCGCGGGNKASQTIEAFSTNTFINENDYIVSISTPVRVFNIPANSVALNVPNWALSYFTNSPAINPFNKPYNGSDNLVGYVL